MKNKILLSLIFIIFFLIVISFNSDVSAFTFSCDNITYDTANYDILDLYDYSLVLNDSSENCIYFLTSDSPFCTYGYNDKNGFYTLYFDKTTSVDLSYRVYKLYYNNGETELNKAVLISDYSTEKSESIIFGYRINSDRLIYLNYDLYDIPSESYVFYANDFSNDIKELILYKSTNDYTTKLPITIYSQDFNEDSILEYSMEYSKDNKNWSNCTIRSIVSFETSNTVYQFKLDVYENGTYYFRLQNKETGEYFYNSVVIDNIVYTQDNHNNYINGEFMPQPWFNCEYISDTKIKLYSQAFTEEEIRQLECSYGKDLETADLSNDEKWTKLEVESSYSEVTRSYEYRFVLYVDNSNYDGDGDYYFRLYIIDKDKYTYCSFNVIFEEIIKYNNSLNKEETNRYLALFRDRFGFLFYPFDLFINIFDHLSNINFDEPIVYIPDIYEPATDVKLISAVEFNFNDLLKNNVLKNVHDIYLILVDGFVVFSLSNLLYKKLMGVLGNG